MLTNSRDAFRDQSRSPNMVSFDMLAIVSSDVNETKFLPLEVNKGTGGFNF